MTKTFKTTYHLAIIIIGFFMFSHSNILYLCHSGNLYNVGLIFIAAWLLLIVFSNSILFSLFPHSNNGIIKEENEAQNTMGNLYYVAIKTILLIALFKTMYELFKPFLYYKYDIFYLAQYFRISKIILIVYLLLKKEHLIQKFLYNNNSNANIRDVFAFFFHIISLYLIFVFHPQFVFFYFTDYVSYFYELELFCMLSIPILLFSHKILKYLKIGNQEPKAIHKSLLNYAIKIFSLLIPLNLYLISLADPDSYSFCKDYNTEIKILLTLSILFFLLSKRISTWLYNHLSSSMSFQHQKLN